ncbi:conserved hypothetical protein [Culex quinquefasciatus]|uniref:Uncharacterized protein n=1 Tax=Culex quinquefasciatus TaxID=7176 RepID=B0VZA7_CULQU|nr:conserved hypothetical protein [Culex quinquefasciatus]|eukprot:XP_001841756.1 conserved hypothetical protein [Culex quinquefasciatus]
MLFAAPVSYKKEEKAPAEASSSGGNLPAFGQPGESGKNGSVILLDLQGPLFLSEPQHRIEFSNNSGTHIECTGHGSPPPDIYILYMQITRIGIWKVSSTELR